MTTSRRMALALCLLFAAAIPFAIWKGDPLAHLLSTTPLPRKLGDAVPAVHAGWTGRDEPLTEHEVKTIQCDDYVQRMYGNAGGEAASLFVSYYGNKERGLQRWYHNPTICYPAAGWALVGTKFETVTLEDVAVEVPTCRYTFEQSGRRLLVVTFFKIDDEFLDESPRNQPMWMFKHGLVPQFDDAPGTFVQVNVVVPVTDGDEGAANALATRFLRAFGRPVLAAVSAGAGT